MIGKIITTNKELYVKFNMLHFTDEIVIKKIKDMQVNKIINNINKKNKVLEIKDIGDYFVIKKLGKFKCNVYLK